QLIAKLVRQLAQVFDVAVLLARGQHLHAVHVACALGQLGALRSRGLALQLLQLPLQLLDARRRLLRLHRNVPGRSAQGRRGARSARCSKCVALWLRRNPARRPLSTISSSVSPTSNAPSSIFTRCTMSWPTGFCVSITWARPLLPVMNPWSPSCPPDSP